MVIIIIMIVIIIIITRTESQVDTVLRMTVDHDLEKEMIVLSWDTNGWLGINGAHRLENCSSQLTWQITF